MGPYNLFNTQSQYQNNGIINGIPSNSPMYQNYVNSLNSRTGNAAYQNGSINNQSLSNVSGNLIQGGVIQGTALFIGNAFKVDASGTTFASSGTIAAWSFNPSTISSLNGNIVFDSVNNRILLYNNSVPQVLIQG